MAVEPKRLSDDALAALAAFDFPGNVRQLENLCHWLTVMAPAQVVEVKDLPPEILAALAERSAVAGAGSGVVASVPTPPGDGHAAPAAPPPGAEWPGWAPVMGMTRPPTPGPVGVADWEAALQAEALAQLAQGRSDVWDGLMRRVETRLIQAALQATRGRRIEAAQRLGIGRNTITRKIQELGLE